MEAHLSRAPCQSGCQGFGSQGLSAGSFQQGFLNSDPWANWLNQRQGQEFYNQQLLLQQQFRNAQSVPVPPSVSSTPGNQGPVYQGQGFGSVGRGDSVTRILNTFQEVKVKEVPGVLYSDSESALKLLRNLDVPRKSRHLEIRIEWIKERVSLGQLSLIFRKGVDNPSDLLTKCLGSAAFGIHRSTLGFQVSEGSLAGLVAVAKRSLVFIEVCCRENSAICQACRDMGIQYIGISKDMEKRSVFSNLLETLKQMKQAKVYVHVSSPCTPGSPLRNFSRDDSVSKADVVWFDVFPKVAGYLKLGDHSSFELPWRNAIWNHVMTKRTLTDAKHVHEAGVHLCATGAVTSNNQPIGKVLGFTGTSRLSMMNLRKEFGQCNCTMPHGSFSDVDWTETAYYNPKLAKVIVKGAILALTRET